MLVLVKLGEWSFSLYTFTQCESYQDEYKPHKIIYSNETERMGNKGDKMTNDSIISAELLVEKLTGLGEITSKKMFGGHGIFHEGKMFGLIDSKGNAFLKADDSLKVKLESRGAVQHSRMPYYSITPDIFESHDELQTWAKKSIILSKG